MTGPADDAIQQISLLRDECIDLLNKLKAFSPPDAHGKYPDTFRLVATPMLYSVWERCFTLCHAVGLRFIRDMTLKAIDLEPSQRSIWLLHTPFYQSLTSRLRDGFNSIPKKIKKGQFSLLCEFLPKLDEWLLNGLDQSIPTDSLVMTFSNVNREVVELNALALGIADFPQFKSIKLGRLNDLVGQRNDIGHGAVIRPPSNDTFQDLWDFTENLITQYCGVFLQWIRARFSEENEKDWLVTTA